MMIVEFCMFFFSFFFSPVECEGKEQEREAGWILQSPYQIRWWDFVVRTEGNTLYSDVVKWAGVWT